jgi:hypothetical protein
VERRRVGHLPADDLEIVGPALAELDAVGVLVHSQVGRRRGVAWHELHAEHAGGEPAPSGKIADAENEIAELIHAGHGIFPPWVADL